MVGDDLQEPFALIVDEFDGSVIGGDVERLHTFGEQCEARAVLAVQETVEVVDRYEDTAAEPVTVNMSGTTIREPGDLDLIAARLAVRLRASRPVEEISLYRERAHLVAYLSTQYPSVIAYNDPKEPDWPVVYVTTPAGQMSWHIAESDLDLFEHVPRDGLGVNAGPEWDGHSTIEKYRRLNLLTQDIADRLPEA
jgi:hypothetical protein